VFNADHGEAHGEHETFGHEYQLYEENIHVPLVISESIDVDSEQPISLRQLPNLITNLANGKTEENLNPRSYAISRTSKDDKIALRFKQWKYIDSDKGSNLFTVTNEEDPLENDPLQHLASIIVYRTREQDREFQRIRNEVELTIAENVL